MNLLGILIAADSDSVALGWGVKVCSSNEVPGAADAALLQTPKPPPTLKALPWHPEQQPLVENQPAVPCFNGLVGDGGTGEFDCFYRAVPTARSASGHATARWDPWAVICVLFIHSLICQMLTGSAVNQ